MARLRGSAVRNSAENRASVIRPITIKQQLVDNLIGAIRRGELAPGSMISAKRVAEEYGVSRTPAREAVDTLATLKLVSWVTNTGAKVCVITADQLIDLLAMRGEGPEFRSAQKLGQERGPEKRAETSRALREHLQAMEMAVKEQEAAKRDVPWDEAARQRFYDLDIEFHRLMARLAGSEDAEHLVSYFMNRIRLFAVERLSPPEQIQREHANILTAIEKYPHRDQKTADGKLRQAVRAHMLGTMSRWDQGRVQEMANTLGWEMPEQLRKELQQEERNRGENRKSGGAATRSSRRT